MKQRCPLGCSQATIPYGTSAIEGVLRRGPADLRRGRMERGVTPGERPSLRALPHGRGSARGLTGSNEESHRRGATPIADGVLAGGGGLSGGEFGCPGVVKSTRCWMPDSLRNFKISPAAILTPRGLQ